MAEVAKKKTVKKSKTVAAALTADKKLQERLVETKVELKLLRSEVAEAKRVMRDNHSIFLAIPCSAAAKGWRDAVALTIRLALKKATVEARKVGLEKKLG